LTRRDVRAAFLGDLKDGRNHGVGSVDLHEWPLFTVSTRPFGDSAAVRRCTSRQSASRFSRVAVIGRGKDDEPHGRQRRPLQQSEDRGSDALLSGRVDAARRRRHRRDEDAGRLERARCIDEHDPGDCIGMIAGEGLDLEAAEGMTD
jgi:hypothetical protein